QSRLARVRVAGDRRRLERGSTPAGALLVALRAHLLDLAVEVADPLANAPPLDLDLLLAEAAARPHSPTPAAHLAVVGVGADQPWQQVVQPCRLDLQPALMGARVLSKDLEDDLRPIEHARLER